MSTLSSGVLQLFFIDKIVYILLNNAFYKYLFSFLLKKILYFNNILNLNYYILKILKLYIKLSIIFYIIMFIIGIPKASLIGLTTSRVSSTPPILMSNSGPSSASSTTCKNL